MVQPTTASAPPRPTVLVADDDPALRRALAGILQSEGHHPLEAEDGWRALEILRLRHVDLVITDLDMPGIDGIQLLLAMSVQFPQVPAIVLTGIANPSSLRLPAQLQGVRVFAKPPDPEALLAEVSNAIRLHPPQPG